MSVEIAPMRLEDLEEIRKIEEASFTFPWPRNSFYRELSENRYAYYAVARLEGGQRVVGYAGMWVVFLEAHITTLAVAHPYRRKGVGSALLAHLLKVAMSRGAREVWLEVRDSNEVARKLYEKFGFELKGIRKKYYQEEDALVMARYLEGQEQGSPPATTGA